MNARQLSEARAALRGVPRAALADALALAVERELSAARDALALCDAAAAAAPSLPPALGAALLGAADRCRRTLRAASANRCALPAAGARRN